MEIPVLDKGFVRLDDAMADDLSVVNSARVSFNKHHEIMEKGDDKLIAFLMKNRHGTPFEHNSFRFHVKAPIFVVREWQRHRISSYNEWSARYSELEPDFYVPDKKNWRIQTGKPGSYTFEIASDAIYYANEPVMKSVYSYSWQAYKKMLSDGVAKEQARLVLPLAIYTQMYWTVNARSLMNFLSLRNADQAMWEIQQYAKAIEVYLKELMPATYQAFIENGRIAP